MKRRIVRLTPSLAHLLAEREAQGFERRVSDTSDLSAVSALVAHHLPAQDDEPPSAA